MIPKSIRTFWFGNQPFPNKYQQYFDHTVELHPGWSVQIITEAEVQATFGDRPDLYGCPLTPRYVKDAYKEEKWAFVADYYRLLYMYQLGGITLDADVEVLQPLDKFLTHSFFSGMEINHELLVTATMGSRKWGKLAGALLALYRHAPYTELTNTKRITKFIKDECNPAEHSVYNDGRHSPAVVGSYQGEAVVLYPQEVFCPYNHKLRKATPTELTYAIHHFGGSWLKK